MDENERRASELNKSEENGKYDDNNLIIDETEAAGNVIDIYTLLATSKEPAVVKLNNLMALGVTEKEVVDAYQNLDGNAETIEQALDKLGLVFFGLARYFSDLSNGIVVDIKTGEMDRQASIEQMLEVGILAEDGTLDYFKMSSKEGLEEIFRLLEPTPDEIAAAKENISIRSMFSQLMSPEALDIDKFLDVDPKSLELEKDEEEMVEEQQREIKGSDFYKDDEMYEIYRLYIEAEEQKGTAEHAATMHKLRSMIRKHPDKAQEVTSKLFNPDKTMNTTEVAKFKIYEARETSLILIGQWGLLKNLDVNNLTPDQKKAFFITAMAMGNLQMPGREGVLDKVAMKMMMKIDPRITPKMGKREFYKCVSENLGVEIKSQVNYDRMASIATTSIDKAIHVVRENTYDKDRPITDREFSKSISKKDLYEVIVDRVGLEITQEELEKKKRTPAENYFYRSKIEFSKEDEASFNKLYRDCTVDSWLQNKESALLMRHTALLTAKESLESKPQTEYYKAKLESINRQIAEFEEQYPDTDCRDANGNISPDCAMVFDTYKHNLHDAGLYKYYVLDMNAHNNNEGYDTLDDDHKKAYLRNIMVGLAYAEMKGEEGFDSVLGKMNLRRLELLNDEEAGKVFVTFDKKKNPIINKEMILQEYQSMSRHTWNSYEDLEASAIEARESYVLKKLEEYQNLPEDAFQSIDITAAVTGEERKDLMLKRIEQIRLEYNASLAMKEKSFAPETDSKTSTTSYERSENQGQTPVLEDVNVYGEDESIDRHQPPVVESKTGPSGNEMTQTAQMQNNSVNNNSNLTQDNSTGFFGRFKNGLNKMKNVFAAVSNGKGIIDAIKEEFSEKKQLPSGGDVVETGEEASVGDSTTTTSKPKDDPTKPKQYKVGERVDIDHQAAVRKTEQSAARTPENPDVGLEME